LLCRIWAGNSQESRAGIERKYIMEMNGADILVHCLAEEGVKHVFGYPGGAVLYIYDAILSKTSFNTSWYATSKLPCMPPMPIRARRRKLVFAW
jgi:Thiamine pyrophosphate enzyme, N-terminal TPP binding domain